MSDPVPATARLVIETPHLEAAVALRGYVSGVAAGSLLDKKTGARDLGFGLVITDFLLESAPSDSQPVPGQYEFGNAYHGRIAKRFVEGPQICTQAMQLPARVFHGPNFLAVRLAYRWTQAFPPRTSAGSVWEQTLVFPFDTRYFFAADRVTTVSESAGLVMRLDMPGHIKHERGSSFEHIYLSYHTPSVLPSTAFHMDFPPDGQYLYQRGNSPRPERFIRAYQIDLAPGQGEGPWLAGMTLNPDDVAEAWCHQRGYVCMIEEIGGRPTRRGDTFGACYIVGWFDGLDDMHAAYDAHKGWSGLAFDGPAQQPTGFHGVGPTELTEVGPLE
jgi:hypothetical protein